LVDTTLVAPLGRTDAVIVLSGLSFLTAALAYRRGAAEGRSSSSKAEVPTRASATGREWPEA
jgi:hypothetical protein